MYVYCGCESLIVVPFRPKVYALDYSVLRIAESINPVRGESCQVPPTKMPQLIASHKCTKSEISWKYTVGGNSSIFHLTSFLLVTRGYARQDS